MPTKIPKNKAEIIEKLSRDQTLISGNIETALNKIGRVCTKALNIEEVTFWQFTQNSENLTCITSYKVGQKLPAKTKQFRTQLVRDYIKTLQNGLYTIVFDSSHKIIASAGEFLRKEIKGSLHVPVYIGSTLGGVVQFNQLKKQRNWTLADCVFACQAADLTADTLQNFGTKGNEKYTLDIMDTLGSTLDHVLKVLDLDNGMIRLDEIPVTRGYSPEIEMEFVNQYRISPEFSYRTNIVTNVHQAVGDSKGLVEALKNSGVRAFITVPITIDTYQAGCIHVASYTVMDWNQEAISLLEWTARHVARIVNDIWTHQDNRTLSSLIQTFHDNASTLNRMMLFEEAVKVVGKSATDVLETDMAFIILRNPDNTITCPWISGLTPDTINRIIDTEGASVQSMLRNTKTPILFPDVRKSVLPTSLQRHLVEKKAKSTRIFPLVYEGHTMGAVVGFYKQVRMFTRNERSILSLFANSAALAMQNAWMYDQVRQGYMGLALALANAEDAREDTIPDASLRSAKLAEETARALKVPENEVGAFHLSYKVIRQPKVIVHIWRVHLRQMLGEQAENL